MAYHHRTNSTAGRWYLTGLGLVVALIGGLFFWLMWRSFERAREMEAWPETKCVIIDSGTEERRVDPNSPPEYRISIIFGYDWEGTSRTAEHVTWRGNPWSSRKEAVEAEAAEYKPGKILRCHINPDDPDFAILKPDSKAPLYSIWFPALFIVAGLGVAIKANFPVLPKPSDAGN